MASTHVVEYSKSSKAACHGAPPCKGSLIDMGTLRYGAVGHGKYGETVEWRHWGCVTPEILGRLSFAPIDNVPGFNELRQEDQRKIRLAIGLRRVDASDIPDTARVGSRGDENAAPGPSQAKRKAAFEIAMAQAQGPHRRASQPSSSQKPPSSQGPRLLSAPTASQIAAEVEEEIPDQEEIIDELLCSYNTNVVGVQYYNGLVGDDEEVRLIRQPNNQYDRNAIKVENIGRAQVGHIPRQVAARLAPLMDRNQITVEGIVNQGNLRGRHEYTLPMTLRIYGPTDKKAQLEPVLKWATPGQRGFGASVPARTNAASTSAPAPSQAARRAASGPVPRASQPYTFSNTQLRTPVAPASRAPPASQAPAVPRLSAAEIAAQQEAQRKQQEALVRAAELRQILNNLEKVDDEGRRSSLLDTLCSTEDVLSLPVHPNPPGKQSGELKVDLLKHQSQALQWCLEHEYPVPPKKESDKPVQFWQLRKAGANTFYYNIATKTPQSAAPVLGRGALCADSMGLGKTLTMLSLIVATRNDVSKNFSKSTLIVVPLSVMSNWETQIQDHVGDGVLSYCLYYGTGRNMSAEELSRYDVVITTYQTVVGEHGDAPAKVEGDGPSKKRKRVERSLFMVKWKRIILDEGHNIRNPKTKMAQSVCALDAERRWVLSGTPIINSPRDLGSILAFLRICSPLDNEDFFKRMLLRPLTAGDPAGAEMLRALMSHVCIRRTKEMQDSDGNSLVPLPPVEVTMVPVALDPKARELYDSVEELSQQRFGDLLRTHGGIHSLAVQSNVLSMLTRMRQLALHPGLVPPNYLEHLRRADENDDSVAPAIQLTPEAKVRLQGILAQAIEDNEECPICFSIPDQPRITSCSHVFCLPCITEIISRDPKCPMDRRQITLGDLIEPPPPTELTQAPVNRNGDEEDDIDGLRTGSSAKIDQLIYLLKLTPLTEKSLVFSQFTSFLDKIAENLDREGIPYVRFDGQMSARRRQETIARFSVPLKEDEPTVLPTSESAPSSRRRTRSKRALDIDGDVIVNDDKDDGDYVAQGDDDDDDFIEEEVPKPKKRKTKGKGKAKGVSIPFDDITELGNTSSSEVNPKVMLISLKAGALGLNLTVANNVYLMDPWWQEGIESQAIDRCNRIGQTKPVRVYQLIAEKTVESKVIEIQEKKKKLIEQAFSGIKSNETKRQKKEARLQELIELFGARQATQNSAGTSQSTLEAWRA